MTPSSARGRLLLALLVLAPLAVVQCLTPTDAVAQTPTRPPSRGATPVKPDPGKVEIMREESKLPAPVREMREAILAAARSGDIKELLIPIQWNELPPDFGAIKGRDPTDAFKAASVDGQGREILAALASIMTLPCAVVREGRDIENNRVFVWPYLAKLALGALTPEQEVDLLRLIPRETYAAAKKSGAYTHWYVAIGADGTWHAFRRPEN